LTCSTGLRLCGVLANRDALMTIDGQRLLADLQALRGIGRDRTGVHRPALSDDDIAARHWLIERMRESGLEPEMDGLGNVIGRTRHAGPAVLIGSHTDTVPHGGWLDGALGVAYGLEVARARPELAIDVVSFQDEEGTFSSCSGSRAFTGLISAEDLADRRSAEGVRLGDALVRHGLDCRPWFRLEPVRYHAFLEAHIEQGPVLEREGIDIAVVTGIVASQRWRLTFTGQADHAGTTPMAMRRDAGACMVGLAAQLLASFRAAAAANTVWNLGHLSVSPGAYNVVPAAAELFVEFRDLDQAVVARLAGVLEQAIEQHRGTVEIEAQRTSATDATAMSEDVIATFEAAAAACGKSSRRQPSGAGHDAMYLARQLPAGMIFIPSIDGRSHDVSEDSHEHDIIAGCEVMAEAASRLLAG